MSQNKVLVKDIAIELGITNASVSTVIHGKRKNPRVRKAIARSINKPVSEVFSDAT